MIDIAFVNETETDITPYELLIESVFKETMKQLDVNRFYEVSVVFVTKEKIKEINKEYRNLNQVTDVISFALFDENPNDDIIQDTTNISTLGDIFICFDKMLEQAEEYQHSKEREMAFLACHGFLHLLGFDHNNPDEEKAMFLKQDEILKSLNINR